jgi:phosphate starvation-inducible membrane PsiE
MALWGMFVSFRYLYFGLVFGGSIYHRFEAGFTVGLPYLVYITI